MHENSTIILTSDWSLLKSDLRTQSQNHRLRLELKEYNEEKNWQKITKKWENERPEKENSPTVHSKDKIESKQLIKAAFVLKIEQIKEEAASLKDAVHFYNGSDLGL